MNRKASNRKDDGMRTYPSNSAQAAARIVALTVLADGDIGNAEIDLIRRVDVPKQLGLSQSEFDAVVDTFCEDLLSSKQLIWADACPVDERTLAQLMGEIDEPNLRRQVLRLCVEIAEVDSRVTDGESIVLVAAVEHWGLHHEMLKPPGGDTSAEED